MAIACVAGTCQAVSVTDGTLTVEGIGNWGPHNYGGGVYHTPYLDWTALNSGGPVALRGWVDLGQMSLADSGENMESYFSFTLIDWDHSTWGTRKEVKINFTNSHLDGWYGIQPQPWDRIRPEQTNLTNPPASPEEWYATEGGTSDVGSKPEIYPSDRLYYFQLIVDPNTKVFDVWVYGKGNGGGLVPPLSNNSFDTKQWYNIGQYDVSGTGFELDDILVYPHLFGGPDLLVGQASTVSWTGVEIGAPISTEVAPPSPEVIPEPITLLGTVLASGCLGGYIRRRRTA
jgi:hypothetical protein